MRIRRTLNRSRALRVGTLIAVAGAMVGGIATSAYAATPALTPVPTKVVNGATTSVVATVATGTTLPTSGMAVLLVAPGSLSSGACPTYPASVSATNFTYSSSPATGIVAATGVTSTTAAVTFTVPATIALPAAGTLASQSVTVCAYPNTTSGTAANSATSTTPLTVLAPDVSNTLTLNPRLGAGGSGTVVATTWDPTNSVAGANFATGTVFVFETSACSVTYPTLNTSNVSATVALGTGTAANTATVTVPTTVALAASAHAANWSLCAYTATSGATLAWWSGSGAYLLTDSQLLTVSPASGPTGGANTVIATVPSSATGTFLAGSTYVQFDPIGVGATNNCAATWTTPTTGGSGNNILSSTDVRVLSDVRLAIVVPNVSSSYTYNICAYAGNTNGSSLLIAASGVKYTVAAKPVVTIVTPSSGPAAGGTVVTVYGTFPNSGVGLTVTLGGSAVTLTRYSGTSFTFTTPAHQATTGGLALAVTNTGGTATVSNAFSYANAITVTPRYAANTGNVDLDVQGAGFVSIDFTSTSATNTNGTTPDSTYGHVYLARGVLDPTPTGTGSPFKTLHESDECRNVLVVSDAELVCTLLAAGNALSTQRPTALDLSGKIDLTSGSTTVTAHTGSTPFTPTDVGTQIIDSDTPANIPAGTVITQVVDSTHAIMSNPAGGASAVGGDDATVVLPRSVTDGATSSNQLTSTAASFGADDVGLPVYGSGILPGTTITGVSGNVATLSQAVATSGSSLTCIIGGSPLSQDTYTVTVVSDGRARDQSSNSAYTQSVVSSGSTFTVAPF